jgi:hypothetical protein
VVHFTGSLLDSIASVELASVLSGSGKNTYYNEQHDNDSQNFET